MAVRSPEEGLEVKFQRHLPACTWGYQPILDSFAETISDTIRDMNLFDVKSIENNDLVVTISLRPL